MKATYKNGIFNFEIDGYAVELYKENEIWLDKVYTLFGHVINRVSSEKSIKFSEVVQSVKKDIQEAKKMMKYFAINQISCIFVYQIRQIKNKNKKL